MTDAIFILQNSINISSKPPFLCFIDLKAAYDWLNRDMLFKILEICLKHYTPVHQLQSKVEKHFLKHFLAADRVVLNHL